MWIWLWLGGCLSGLAAVPGIPPARLVGEHCIHSSYLAYGYQQEHHQPEEILARRAFARRTEAIRFTLGADGTVSIRQLDGSVLEGAFVAANAHEGGWSGFIRWKERAPDGVVLVGPGVDFAFDGDANFLRVSGPGAGVVPEEWMQLAPPKWCMEPDLMGLRDPKAPPTPPPTDQPAEPWIKTPAAWPQLVLTNDVRFRDGREMPGASSFLVKAEGETLLATALHLVGPAGGVEPAVPLSQLDSKLSIWAAFVRTRPRPYVIGRRIAMTAVDDGRANDWLLLHLDPAERLPATPLTLRTTPVKVGEEVWLVGCEYRDQACKQTTIRGRVSGRMGSKFRYDLEHPVILAGFSGAPVLDARGLVVGLMSVWFDTYDIGEQQLEAGGADASSVLSLISARLPSN